MNDFMEMQYFDGGLWFRHRTFQVDASGAFCGLGDFIEWKKVEYNFPWVMVDGMLVTSRRKTPNDPED